MFAQQESSLLLIFRGMPKQVPAYTALLYRGQNSLWWLSLKQSKASTIYINSVVQQVKGMQYRGAASYMIATFRYSTVGKWLWLQELGKWVPPFRIIPVLAGLTGNSQHWLWFTGVFTKLVINHSCIYQAQKWICISYHSMLNYFLNQSRNVKVWYTSC